MNGTPRVSAPPHRRSAPSAPYPADRSRISLPGNPNGQSYQIILAIRRIPDYRISAKTLRRERFAVLSLNFAGKRLILLFALGLQ